MSKKKRTGKRPARPPLIDFDLDNAVFVDFETYGKGARDDRPVLVTVLDMRRLARADRERGARLARRATGEREQRGGLSPRPRGPPRPTPEHGRRAAGEARAASPPGP